MMAQFPQDDEKLVTFLRQHRPIPPTAKPNLENQLMEFVEREAMSPPKDYPLLWMVSSAIAGTLLLVLGGYRSFNVSPQLATNSEEIEAFLIDGWHGTIEEKPLTSPMTTLESEWLILADPQITYAVSTQ